MNLDQTEILWKDEVHCITNRKRKKEKEKKEMRSTKEIMD
jgi:hypothetical protein